MDLSNNTVARLIVLVIISLSWRNLQFGRQRTDLVFKYPPDTHSFLFFSEAVQSLAKQFFIDYLGTDARYKVATQFIVDFVY